MHQAITHKNAPMPTAHNCCKDINALKRIPGINTISEYFIPFVKFVKYSVIFIFNNFFK